MPPDRLGDYLRGFERCCASQAWTACPTGTSATAACMCASTSRSRARRRPAVPGFRRGGRRSHGRPRRQHVRRARRRPREVGAAVADVLPQALDLFAAVKHLFDPDDLLNPGVLVAPRPVEADLRLTSRLREPRRELRLVHDSGSVVDAVHRCTGVGKCLADNTGAGGVMCPSYVATRDEKDSTRGRARVLQEMVNRGLVSGGWRSDEVHEALDLCLSCKGCASDCPTGIDMATYKAEALHQRYRHRPRPRSHYALGQLPRWARLAQPAAPLLNRLMGVGAIQRVAKAAAGVDARRSLPTFEPRPIRRSVRGTSHEASPTATDAYDVVVWADTFTDGFASDSGRAAIEVLERAGLRVGVVGESACCGLTWISTGQLRRPGGSCGAGSTSSTRTSRGGVPAPVGLEPSCTRHPPRSDAVELTDDPRAAEVAAGVRSLAEVLSGLEGWAPSRPQSAPPSWSSRTATTPGVIGWQADADLLARTGASLHPGGRLLRAGRDFGCRERATTRCRSRSPSTICCRRSGQRGSERWCSRTASRAGPEWPTWPT